jgi:anti-sigma regulatory factor (Ser/Thr protein kinase)
MAERVDRLQVFVASPGDTAEERERLEVVVGELNKGIAKGRNLVLELVRWETDVRPGLGNDAQDVINRQLPEADIVIGIFWARLGTPTPRAASGTVEELEAAIERWRSQEKVEIMVYFNQQPTPPLSNDLDQLRRLQEFRRKLQAHNLVWEYDGVDDFETKVRRHLTRTLLDWPPGSSPGLTIPTAALPPARESDQPFHGVKEEVDPRRESDLHTVAAQVRAELLRHEFGAEAGDRAATVVLELLANVRDHTQSRRAEVKVGMKTDPLSLATVEVAHDGEAFDLKAAVEAGLSELQRGEREHGLLKVTRLASGLRVTTENTPSGTVAVQCDIYEPRFLGSGLLEANPRIKPIYQEFDVPRRWRIGREIYLDRDLWRPLHYALRAPAPELLDLYLGGLRIPDDGYLAIEFVGRVVVSEIGLASLPAEVDSSYPPTRSLDPVEAALEARFHKWFDERRVILHGHETNIVSNITLQGWAGRWDLPCFTEPDDLRRFLGELP